MHAFCDAGVPIQLNITRTFQNMQRTTQPNHILKRQCVFVMRISSIMSAFVCVCVFVLHIDDDGNIKIMNHCSCFICSRYGARTSVYIPADNGTEHLKTSIYGVYKCGVVYCTCTSQSIINTHSHTRHTRHMHVHRVRAIAYA